MRETRSSGSVRGASGDGRPYRERNSPVPADPGEGLFTEPTTADRRQHGTGATASRGTFATAATCNICCRRTCTAIA